MQGQGLRGQLDTTSVAGIAVFGSLAVMLAAVSQSLGLNFPVIPYLQFDLGELAIILAFFIFGPLPAFLASFVEAGALEIFGQNLPIGPAIKLLAALSSVAGLWLGTWIATRLPNAGLGRVVGSGALFGSVVRVAVMTVANYYLITFLYTLTGTVSYYNLPQTFSLIGVGLNPANTLFLILGFTGFFNVLQLLFVMSLSYTVLRVPHLSQVKVGGRVPWFASVLRAKGSPSAEQIS